MPAKKTVKRTVTTRTSKKPSVSPTKNEGTGKSTAKKPIAKKKSNTKTSGTKKKEANSSNQESSNPERDELISLLSDFNGEEITWLLTQARTIIYNHKVEEVNKAAKNLVDVKGRKTKSGDNNTKGGNTEPELVSIEPTGNGKSFVIIMGIKRLFVSLKELKELVKLTQVTDDPTDASKRLFAWMNRERSDMVIDAGITGPGDPRLPPLFRILRDKFTVG